MLRPAVASTVAPRRRIEIAKRHAIARIEPRPDFN
jgi:hypothetical protein